MKLFTQCDGCECDLLCIHIGIAHHNHTEWVWNPFMCDIGNANALHAEQIAPCEHFHKPTYNPFHFIKLQINKSQSQTKTHHVNEPLNVSVDFQKVSCREKEHLECEDFGYSQRS